MKASKAFASLTLGVVLLGRLGMAGAVLADRADPSPSASPSPTESVSPSPSPSASDSPSPSPSPSASPSPDPSPAPSDSPSASPSPSQSPRPSSDRGPGSATGADPSQTGPGGCTGVVPDWVFDTGAQHWVEADTGSFSCDTASGLWLSPKYYYDKRSGWYEIIPAAAPKPDYLVTAPNVIHTALGDLVVGSKDYQMAQALGLLGSGGITVSGTGADSTNQAGIQNSNQNWIDLTNLVNVINTLQSAASSGGVAASGNTQVGSAVTGAASVLANVINLLASAWSWSSGSLSFFMQNIMGNQVGDIALSPTQSATSGGGQLGSSANVSGTGPGSTNVAGVDNSSGLTVNAKSAGNIANNIDVNAQSGNALANGNTSAGNVASGNATAEVNIINLINSFISSGSSFFGVLNIFGNLNGDVLFPNGFLNGLIGSGSGTPAAGSASVSGTGPGSTNQAGISGNGQANVTNSSANGVANNITTTAASGGVGADSNTTAGKLQSGASSTDQGLFNLSNTSLFGDNAVLVIVNVLGHWVGKIMNLPGGSTNQSALLTGNATVGVNGTGPNSSNSAQANNSAGANINQKSTGTITNNVNVKAQSGSADATNNTKVGDITSGDAKATSSVANIFNTVLNVKKWFGVLIINVFGNWTGDVNHDSAAGTVAGGSGGPAAATPAASEQAAAGLAQVAGIGQQPSGPVVADGVGGSGAGTGTVAGAGASGSRVLTAAAAQPAAQSAEAASQGHNMSLLFGLSAIVMLVAGALASVERRLKSRR